jgi:hypothetical protein
MAISLGVASARSATAIKARDTRAPGLLLEHDVLSPWSTTRQVKDKFVSPERQEAWKL